MTWIFAAIGAVLGALHARRRKGNGMDIAQYAAVYAIALGLVGLILNLILLRLA